MLKRLFLIPLIFFSFLTPLCFSNKDFSLSAESAVLVSPFTKKVIYSKNPHLRLAPASTVKIMTALVVLKNSHLRRKAIVSKFASSMEPSKIYIKEGEVYFIEDLLEAILLNSGNDASVTLAEAIAGSEEEFVKMMNDTVRAIGAKNTNFKNSNGLPAEEQYSTAYDLSLIVREAMKYKKFADIMKMKKGEIEEVNTLRRIKLKNHNKGLWNDKPYMILGKTGYTKKARHCFAGYIQYNRWRKVIVVILKSENMWPDLEELAK
ncbi:MAG: D-alanyl-D-alanine carboxypeptidase [Candidatus Omnitrophica bacterium]|nr:D-alanyl-D-alanine carboxypeptidase [Candidatus Omnitrophota bacterium]